MKRPLKRNGRAATSHPGGARFAAAWVVALFALLVGCTGMIGPMQSGAGGRFESERFRRLGHGRRPDGR